MAGDRGYRTAISGGGFGGAVAAAGQDGGHSPATHAPDIGVGHRRGGDLNSGDLAHLPRSENSADALCPAGAGSGRRGRHRLVGRAGYRHRAGRFSPPGRGANAAARGGGAHLFWHRADPRSRHYSAAYAGAMEHYAGGLSGGLRGADTVRLRRHRRPIQRQSGIRSFPGGFRGGQ